MQNADCGDNFLFCALCAGTFCKDIPIAIIDYIRGDGERGNVIQIRKVNWRKAFAMLKEADKKERMKKWLHKSLCCSTITIRLPSISCWLRKEEKFRVRYQVELIKREIKANSFVDMSRTPFPSRRPISSTKLLFLATFSIRPKTFAPESTRRIKSFLITRSPR